MQLQNMIAAIGLLCLAGPRAAAGVNRREPAPVTADDPSQLAPADQQVSAEPHAGRALGREPEPGALPDAGWDMTDIRGVILTTAAVPAAQGSMKTAFNYFLRKGLTKAQSAGIIGNLMQESSGNPGAVQGNRGPGRGIAQWEAGGRWNVGPNSLTAYAKAHRASPWALNTQLDFIWYELNTVRRNALGAIHAAGNDVVAATRAFQTQFEGCSACNEAQRIANARAALRAYGGGSPPAPPRVARRRRA